MNSPGRLWLINLAPGQRPSRYIRLAVLALPLVLLLSALVQFPRALHSIEQTLGVLALVVAPGYVVLRLLGLDPLAARSPGYAWFLVVPLSLAVAALLGTFLALTPIGLSAGSLWSGLSILVLASVAVTRQL